MKHEPFYSDVPDARVCVLMVHGFFGGPGHFEMLLPRIPKDWAIRMIRLEGHGGTIADFARARRAMWEAQVERELLDVCQRYEAVVIVAHSMGCMLSANAAVKLGVEKKISAMLFLGAALYPKCDPSFILTSLRFIWCDPAKDTPCLSAARACCGVTVHKRMWEYPTCIPPLLDLLAIARYTRKQIGSYDLPMIALQSYKDEVVNRRSIKPFLANPRARGEFLMDSGHFYYPKKDAERICDVFDGVVSDANKKLQKVTFDN